MIKLDIKQAAALVTKVNKLKDTLKEPTSLIPLVRENIASRYPNTKLNDNAVFIGLASKSTGKLVETKAGELPPLPVAAKLQRLPQQTRAATLSVLPKQQSYKVSKTASKKDTISTKELLKEITAALLKDFKKDAN